MPLKNILFVLFVFLLSNNSFSQLSFEEGYLINNAGNRINCFIKNYDWKNNPTEFKYRESENSELKVGSITTVKEFGIINVSTFKRFSVEIDRSKVDIKNMSTTRQPVFTKETLFLRELVVGEASLYSYLDGNLTRFFYKTGNSEIAQLVYKKYIPTSETRTSAGYQPIEYTRENKRYKQQLWQSLKCDDITLFLVENTSYNKQSLIKLFKRYNKCKNPENVSKTSTHKNQAIRVSVRPGLTYSHLLLQNTVKKIDSSFGYKYGYRCGLEIEHIFPFNNNKWSIFIEPTYQYYKSESEVIVSQTSTAVSTMHVKVDYKSIEIPIGGRYYSYLNNDSKLLYNAAFVIDIPFSIPITAERESMISDQKNTRPNFILGLGFKYKNKYGLELRYGTARNIIGKSRYKTYYNSISLITGFTF